MKAFTAKLVDLTQKNAEAIAIAMGAGM